MSRKQKRILFITPPGYGHIFPMVPLAWALYSLGHEVLVATSGVSVAAAARAGLSVVNVAAGADLPSIYLRFRDGFRDSFRNPAQSGEIAADPGSLNQETVFTALGEVMLEGVFSLVQTWRPDLIVHTPCAGAGPIAASKWCIPAVFLGTALAYTPEVMLESIYLPLARKCEQLGLGTLDAPAAWVDVAPPSLRDGMSSGWPMRYVPYTGGEFVNIAAPGHRGHNRVAVTLGTVAPLAEGLSALRWLVSAAQELDAEFVIALGSADTRVLGDLPSNVRAESWISLGSLLPRSTAAIYHGGSGTMFIALDAGLPQMVIPRGSDQFHNAGVLSRRGAALVPPEESLNAEAVRTLLTSSELRTASDEVSCEMRGMPPPAEVAARILASVA